ncbi:MAG: hypothetical protein KAS72_11435 [Phycisphaerales bacterium]|nr:hypothetical protein [Phycisphaerales bacterium]
MLLTALLSTLGWCALVQACPGDLNGDGCVDQADLGILLAIYGTDGE